MDGYKSANAIAPTNYVTAATPMSGIALRLQELRECCSSLQQSQLIADRIANRVAGSEPEANGAGGKPMPVPNGLSDELSEIIDSFRLRIANLERSLSRTENALG